MAWLDPIICNKKQRWNKNKCRCECKKLIDKGTCDKGYFFNSGNCEWKCDKSCNIGEYLDYLNCKCRKKLVDSLVEECTENIEQIKPVKYDQKKECSSCTVYIVLFSIFFTISIGISIYFVYYYWYFKKYSLRVNFNTHKETTIYWTYKWEELKN